jgi:hypothetical protein
VEGKTCSLGGKKVNQKKGKANSRIGKSKERKQWKR